MSMAKDVSPEAERVALEELMREINDLIVSLSTCHAMLTKTTRDQMQTDLKTLQTRCSRMAGRIYREHLTVEFQDAPRRRKDD